MIRTILREGLEDKGFIEEKTEGIEDLEKDSLPPRIRSDRNLSETEKKDLEKAARAFAQAKNGDDPDRDRSRGPISRRKRLPSLLPTLP